MFIDFPEVDIAIQGIEEIKFPKMVKIRQKFDPSKIDNLPAWVTKEMRNNLTDRGSYQGKKICITAGSRGIPHLEIIIKAVCDELKNWGAEPFIVPAMGSHGGAAAEGQRQYLAAYNVTEESIGVPILSSMEVVKYGELEDGTPLYCDKYAFESDGIVVLNKVKPHAEFRGKHESGLAKMMAIGLANHQGASVLHMKGFAALADIIPRVCEVFMQKVPVAFGVAIVQNAYNEISELEVMPKAKIMERDAALLEIAKGKTAGFKVSQIDVLIIDEIGKSISGNGHDPNITGRNDSGLPGFKEIIDIKKLFIRGLAEGSDRNGSGISSADITTRRCLQSIDWEKTWTNVITSTQLNGGRIPMYMNNDKDALLVAIRTLNNVDFSQVKVVRIKNTLCMSEIEVSENYMDDLQARDDVEILSAPYEMQFDKEGFLL
ncbi:MAG: DUF2088 domain-containing protein [Firmicutes bacterium]|jgi:hypothetical protein|nr:DUF2088 domain-containing protein [Bacillota bacterium]